MTKQLNGIIVNLDASFEKSADSEDFVTISGYASTPALDADGDTILPDAWDLKRYNSNPIILFNHDKKIPIGKVTNIEVTPKGLYITAVISKSSECYTLIVQGILKTFSVGFLPTKLEPKKGKSGGFTISSAELLEISVVSVPSNPEATFSVKKSFDSDKAFEEYFNLKGSESTKAHSKEKKMEDETIDNVSAAVLAAVEKKMADAAVAKAAADAAAAKQAEATNEIVEKRIASATAAIEKSAAEKIEAEVTKRLAEGQEVFQKGMAEAIKANNEELTKMIASKRPAYDRSGNGSWEKEFAQDAETAHLLGVITKKGFDGTQFGKDLITKVNTMSSAQVSSANFEQLVSTNIQKDIQLQLVIANLFPEIQMNSASMIIPIQPDAGYAEITTALTASNPSGKGNLDVRGATYGTGAGVALTEKTFTVKKLISLAVLANDTEEDAILPILPIIRDSMIRSHARAVENGMLVGNTADGYYTSGGINSLGQFAGVGTKFTQAAGSFAATDSYTAANLLAARRNLGKYGINPADVVYIVSVDMYYMLLQDPEWHDVQLVGLDASTKLTGEVGMIYGSKVLVSPEFAPMASAKFFGFAVNLRNFLVPRLRGITSESQYYADKQAQYLVTSQRLNFDEKIAGATAVWGLKHKA